MKFTRKILPSGLTVISSPMKDSLAVTVLVMVKTGSKYETKEINGLSHFLEHMCFKGTAKRPKTSDIAHELDSIGAQYNAFTSQEFTGYYAKADARHFDTILDVVSDIYLNPVFDPAEIEREKGVIIEEINMYEDMPHRQVHDIFSTALYGDQPAGWNILGPKENIQKFTRKDFLKYRDAHYVADATTVIIAGNFDPRTAHKKIARAFATIPARKKGKKIRVIEKQHAPIVYIKKKETDQSHLVMGVRTFKASDKRNAALQVLDAVLGGGMSSRLWQKLREEMGVGYYVRSGTDEFTDHGYFAVSLGVDNSRVIEVIDAVLGEFKKMTETLVDAVELAKAKEYIIGNTSLSLESSDSVAEFFGMQEMSEEKVETPAQTATKIRAVTAADIQKLAKQIFKNDRLVLALIGAGGEDKQMTSSFSF